MYKYHLLYYVVHLELGVMQNTLSVFKLSKWSSVDINSLTT